MELQDEDSMKWIGMSCRVADHPDNLIGFPIPMETLWVCLEGCFQKGLAK